MVGRFGPLKPDEVSPAVIRQWVEECRAKGLSGSTIKVMLACLSGLFVELQEQGLVQSNPTRGLPPSIRRRLRSDHDPRAVPFIERMADVHRVLVALPDHVQRPFALGALAGLRPSEARALRWTAVDLAGGVIHVREQVSGVLKDRESRVVPILDALAPLLRAWHLEAGGQGLVCPPGKHRLRTRHMDRGAPGHALAPVLERLGLRPMSWYQATRHTFASQWVLAGGPMAQLSDILGHSSVAITERYAHLRADLYGPSVRGILGTGRAPARDTAGDNLRKLKVESEP